MLSTECKRIGLYFILFVFCLGLTTLAQAESPPEDLPHYDVDESQVYVAPAGEEGFYFFDEDDEDEYEDEDLADALQQLGLGDVPSDVIVQPM